MTLNTIMNNHYVNKGIELSTFLTRLSLSGAWSNSVSKASLSVGSKYQSDVRV